MGNFFLDTRIKTSILLNRSAKYLAKGRPVEPTAVEASLRRRSHAYGGSSTSRVCGMSGNWGLLVLELIGGGALAAALIYVAAVRYRQFLDRP